MENEIWKPVPSLPKYEASSLGQIRSSDLVGRTGFSKPHRIKKQTDGGNHYNQIMVWDEQKKSPRARLVHHLVLEAFSGPRPAGAVARHLNGNSRDNRACNLKWGTRSENQIDMVNHGTAFGLRCKGSKNPRARLDEDKVRWIRQNYLRGNYYSLGSMAAQLEVSRTAVGHAAHGYTWKHVEEPPAPS